MSSAVIEGNDAVTGHIISTTIGGKNGEPKRVSTGSTFLILFFFPSFLFILKIGKPDWLVQLLFLIIHGLIVKKISLV